MGLLSKAEKFLWILPLVAGVALFREVIRFEYVWDDIRLVQDWLPLYQNIGDAFAQKGVSGLPIYYYRPLLWITLMLDRLTWGISPVTLHATLLLIHGLVILLVYGITRRVLRDKPRASSAAFLSSLLFAFHPMHTEVVCWISGRPDALMTLFFLLAFYFYLCFRDSPQKTGWLFLSLLSFFFSLLSKETAVVFPFTLFLFDRYFPPGNQEKKGGTKKVLWFGIPLLIFLLLRFSVIQSKRIPFMLEEGLWGLTRRFIAAYGFYIKKILLPTDFNAFILELNEGPLFLFATVFFLGLSLCIFWKRKKSPYEYPLLFFCLTLFPATWVAISRVGTTMVAERYLYLPSIAICLLAASSVTNGSPKKIPWLKTGLILAVIFWLGYQTSVRIPVWRNSETFWSETSRRNPGYGLPYHNLANNYERKGDYEKALSLYHKALQVKNRDDLRAVALDSIGMIHYKLGDLEQAEGYLKKALQKHHSALPFCHLGVLYHKKAIASSPPNEKRDWITKAILQVEKCLELDPNLRWHDILKSMRRDLEGLGGG